MRTPEKRKRYNPGSALASGKCSMYAGQFSSVSNWLYESQTLLWQGSLCAAYYMPSDYNATYDCIPNKATNTGDGILGASLYSDRARIYGGVGYLPGTAGNYWSTPDAAANRVTGDITLIARINVADWTPSSPIAILNKNQDSANVSYRMDIQVGGGILLWNSPDGTVASRLQRASSVAVPASDNQTAWIRADLDVDNGASGNTTTFYYSFTDTNDPTAVVWTALGTAQTLAGTTSIFAGTAPVMIGATNGGTSNGWSGIAYYAAVYNGILGTKVVEFNPSTTPNYAYGLRAATGEEWTTQVSSAYDTSWWYKTQPLQLGSAGLYGNARKWNECFYLPGTSGNYATMPHSAALDATGDIDVMAYIMPTDWTPSGYYPIASKRSGSACPWQFHIDTGSTGKLALTWAVSGAFSTVLSSTATGFLDGTGAWVRATRTLNGANQDVRFYYSRQSGMMDVSSITWTQLGTTVSAVSAAPTATTAALYVGWDNATSYFNGQICRVVLKNLGGSTLFDFKPSVAQDLALTFPDNVSGGTWSVVKSASSDTNDPTYLPYSGEKYVYLPGASGNYISTPDAATIDITGDITIRARINLSSYSSLPADSAVIAKRPTDAEINYQMYISSGGGIGFSYSPDGVTKRAVASALSLGSRPGVTNGNPIWIKVTRSASTGTVSYYYSAQQVSSVSSVTWTAIDTSSTTVEGMAVNTGALEIGSTLVGTLRLLTGNVFYADVMTGIDGTVVVKWDASLCGQTGYTDPLNSTVWTVNRASTGKKTVIVDRTSFVLGTDDYFITANHPLLNISATQSFSVFSTARTFGSQASGYSGFISKGTATPSSPGWAVYPNLVAQSVYLELYDGTTAASANAGITVPTAGTAWIGGGVRDVVADTITSYSASVASTPTTDTTTATLANNANPLYIGRRVQGSPTYWEGELFGFAMLRKAATSIEVSAIRTELNGN